MFIEQVLCGKHYPGPSYLYENEFMMLTSLKPYSNQEKQSDKIGALNLKGVLLFTDEGIWA